MSSFNWIGTVPACANEDTLTTILRNEWGFQGMVITDYDGSYGYMITDHCVRTGNDLMLGFSSQASNQLTNTESATLNNALRTSCKNIMYTIANSGYYTNTTDDSGMSNMTKLFVTIDVVTVLLVVLCMALVIVRYRKKHAKAAAEVAPEEKKEDPFIQGMEKVYKQFMTVLESVEVKPIEALGNQFDPNFHNAVMHVEDENFGENEVAEEFQKGYMYRDSVVRHSMVKVAN